MREDWPPSPPDRWSPPVWSEQVKWFAIASFLFAVFIDALLYLFLRQETRTPIEVRQALWCSTIPLHLLVLILLGIWVREILRWRS